MQSHLILWIVVLGTAITISGCGSMEPSGEIMMVDSPDHYRLKRQPAIAILDGVTRMAPTGYSPTESVKSTISDLLSILGNDALKQPDRSVERRQQIEQVIRHRVNYEQMAQRSLGVPWTRLNDPERQEFVSLFVQLLRDTFANKIDQYYDEQIFYRFERREGSFAEVRTNLIGSKVDTALDFRLENHSGNWLVYDVVIDSVSIVRNYRTQFNRIVRDESYGGLVAKLKQRALIVKVFEQTAPIIALSPTDGSTSQ